MVPAQESARRSAPSGSAEGSAYVQGKAHFSPDRIRSPVMRGFFGRWRELKGMRRAPVRADFGHPGAGKALDALRPDELDALDFGVVRLKADGTALQFSKRERHLSGHRGDPVGLNWLRDVAPCMDNPWFRKQLRDVALGGTIDVFCETTGDFNDPSRLIELRIVAGGECGEIWFMLQRR